MILMTLWFLNLAMAAAIIIVLVQKRKRQREEEKQGDRGQEANGKEVRSEKGEPS